MHIDGKALDVRMQPSLGGGLDPVQPSPVGGMELHNAVSIPLGRLAGARGGDKAGNVNIGVWVDRDDRALWLRSVVTADQVAQWLDVAPSRVTVYSLPNLHAVNVVVTGWLGIGVGASLAADAQGKCLAEFIRTRAVDCPVSLL